MTKDLFSEDAEVDEQDLLSEMTQREAHDRLRDELTLFSHPAWPLFTERLEALVKTDLEVIVKCPPDELAPIQARIKAHRHLLGLEDRLRGLEAQLRAEISAPEDDDG